MIHIKQFSLSHSIVAMVLGGFSLGKAHRAKSPLHQRKHAALGLEGDQSKLTRKVNEAMGSELRGVTPFQPAGSSISWVNRAIDLLERDQRRSADTHLIKLECPALQGLDIYLKDESTHPTGSLKHRLARSLFRYGLCNGRIREGVPVVEASSGSTAVSEAYFARMIGIPFYAVMPQTTSPEKICEIERYGGRCHLVKDGGSIDDEATVLVKQLGAHYLDQFTFAERATDWRGNNNIAESIFEQMRTEPHPIPSWIIMGAGTGGTSATIGRYIRYRRFATRLSVVDVEHSAFFKSFSEGDMQATDPRNSRIEGVGRPRVEPSFLPDVIDHMVKVPDAASLAAMRVLSRRIGRRIGGSTGTNFIGLCWAAARMRAGGEQGSLVTLICDSGERYLSTYYNRDWIDASGMDLSAWEAPLERFLEGGPLEYKLAQA